MIRRRLFLKKIFKMKGNVTNYQVVKQSKLNIDDDPNIMDEGTLNEGKGSVQLTSLY